MKEDNSRSKKGLHLMQWASKLGEHILFSVTSEHQFSLMYKHNPPPLFICLYLINYSAWMRFLNKISLFVDVKY